MVRRVLWRVGMLGVFMLTTSAWAEDVALKQDLAIPFVFAQNTNSGALHVGESIPVVISQDVRLGEWVVFKKGTPGQAIVARVVHKAKHIGSTGQITIQTVQTQDANGNPYTLSLNFAVRGNRIIGSDTYYASSVLPLITRKYTPQYIIGTLPAALLIDNAKKREAAIKEDMAFTAYLPEGETVKLSDTPERDVQAAPRLLASAISPMMELPSSVLTRDNGAEQITDVAPEVIHAGIERDEVVPQGLIPFEEHHASMLEQIRASLPTTQTVADETPPLALNVIPLDLKHERIRREYTMIWSYGGGIGNGVFKNIQEAKNGFHDSMWFNLRRNFTDPTRLVQGWWEHGRSVRTNYVAHPLLWNRLGNMEQSWGTQNDHSQTIIWGLLGDIMWKWVIEGTYHAPAPQSEIVDFWAVSMSIALRNTALGHKLAAAPIRYERFGVRHNMSIVPTFTTSISPQGGVRLGTEALWAIR